MLKVILFDADGVLINGAVFSAILERDRGLTKDITYPFFTGIFKECIVGKADLKEVIKPYLKTWGVKESVDEFLNYWFTSEHNINKELIGYIQGLREKGISCYLATNQEKYRVLYMKDEMGFSETLDGIFASCKIGYKKPAKEYFQYIMDNLKGVKKEEIMLWDDTPEIVEEAKNFGIKAEIYTNFEDFRRVTEKSTTK